MSHPHHRGRKSPWKRRTAIAARWLHIYLSMASFGIVLFFAVTGLTLNHAEWFAGQSRTAQFKGHLNRRWLGSDVDKLAIAEYIRRAHHVTSGLSDFRVDDSQIAVSFKGPGYAADTFIERATGEYDLTVTRQGLVGVLNDLHKGRDTGSVWAGIIDVSAVLMGLISLTGLVLIFFLQKRRMPGLTAVAIGAALCLVVYLKWVP
jgi:hypothetical protein